MNANRVEWSLLVDTMWRYQGRESSFGSAGWESWKATASHRFLLRQDTPLSWGWATKPCLTQIYCNYIDPLSLVSPGGFEYYSWRKPAAFGSWSVSIQRTTAGVQRYFLQNGWAVWKKMSQISFHLFLFLLHPASHVHWLILESSSLQAAGIEESLTEIQAFSEGS